MIGREAWYRESDERSFQEAVEGFRHSFTFETLAPVIRLALRSDNREWRQRAEDLHQAYGAAVIRESVDLNYITAMEKDLRHPQMSVMHSPGVSDRYAFKGLFGPLLELSLERSTAMYYVFSVGGMLRHPTTLESVHVISIEDLARTLRYLTKEIQEQQEVYG